MMRPADASEVAGMGFDGMIPGTWKVLIKHWRVFTKVKEFPQTTVSLPKHEGGKGLSFFPFKEV